MEEFKKKHHCDLRSSGELCRPTLFIASHDENGLRPVDDVPYYEISHLNFSAIMHDPITETCMKFLLTNPESNITLQVNRISRANPIFNSYGVVDGERVDSRMAIYGMPKDQFKKNTIWLDEYYRLFDVRILRDGTVLDKQVSELTRSVLDRAC